MRPRPTWLDERDGPSCSATPGGVGVEPATFTSYVMVDGRTRRRHVAAVVDQAGWRSCGRREWKALGNWLTARALEHDTPSVLFRQALRQLGAVRVVRPGLDRLMRAVATSRITAQSEIRRLLDPTLTPERCDQLDAVLVTDPDLGVARLVWINDGVTSASAEWVKTEVAKLGYLEVDRPGARSRGCGAGGRCPPSDLALVEGAGPEPRKLLRALREFDTYIRANAGSIPNYGEFYRVGETTAREPGVSQALTRALRPSDTSRASVLFHHRCSLWASQMYRRLDNRRALSPCSPETGRVLLGSGVAVRPRSATSMPLNVMLNLQRMAGNRAVTGLLSGHGGVPSLDGTRAPRLVVQREARFDNDPPRDVMDVADSARAKRLATAAYSESERQHERGTLNTEVALDAIEKAAMDDCVRNNLAVVCVRLQDGTEKHYPAFSTTFEPEGHAERHAWAAAVVELGNICTLPEQEGPKVQWIYSEQIPCSVEGGCYDWLVDKLMKAVWKVPVYYTFKNTDKGRAKDNRENYMRGAGYGELIESMRAADRRTLQANEH